MRGRKENPCSISRNSFESDCRISVYTCASRGLRLNSFGSILGSRKWIKLHNRTPSRNVRANILISEFVQFALMIRRRKRENKNFRHKVDSYKIIFQFKPVIGWNNFATSKPRSGFTPQVIGKGHFNTLNYTTNHLKLIFYYEQKLLQIPSILNCSLRLL